MALHAAGRQLPVNVDRSRAILRTPRERLAGASSARAGHGGRLRAAAAAGPTASGRAAAGARGISSSFPATRRWARLRRFAAVGCRRGATPYERDRSRRVRHCRRADRANLATGVSPSPRHLPALARRAVESVPTLVRDVVRGAADGSCTSSLPPCGPLEITSIVAAVEATAAELAYRCWSKATGRPTTTASIIFR